MEEIASALLENPFEVCGPVEIEHLLLGDQVRIEIRHAEAAANAVPYIDGVVGRVDGGDPRGKLGQIELRRRRHRQTTLPSEPVVSPSAAANCDTNPEAAARSTGKPVCTKDAAIRTWIRADLNRGFYRSPGGRVKRVRGGADVAVASRVLQVDALYTDACVKSGGGLGYPAAVVRLGLCIRPRIQSNESPVIEDTVTSATLVCHQLRKMGLEPTHARDGEKGIDAFKANRPDLVLLDIIMPGMNGFEVARRIRQLERDGEWTPIIFLTARTSDEDLQRGIEVGGDDYLVKARF